MPESLNAVCQSLSEMAPLQLAESWDNVGLLVGDRQAKIGRVMTCLTVTPDVVDEAIAKQAELIVTHHPLPFRALSRITTDSLPGQMLWRLIGAGVAIYSAHTAFDSAAEGVNQTWAEKLGLASIKPLVPPTDENPQGSGRYGKLNEPLPVAQIIRLCDESANAKSSEPIRGVGDLNRAVSTVGFACGSGGSFISAANRCGCELLITGEATFHQCLEARSLGMALGLLGHYHSERFAMEILARRLAGAWPDLSIWPSDAESDPIVPLPN